MNLNECILEMLKGSTQIAPMLGDTLLEKTGVEPDTLNDALDDLQGRGALNRAEITREGSTFTVLWPTGITPRAMGWTPAIRRDGCHGCAHGQARAGQPGAPNWYRTKGAFLTSWGAICNEFKPHEASHG